MSKRTRFFTLLTLLLPQTLLANIPTELITSQWRKDYKELATVKGWTDFLNNKRDVFPTISGFSSNDVFVIKDEIEINGHKHVYGTGYRQIKLKSTLKRVSEIIRRPDIFREFFGLDEESHSPIDPKNLPFQFTAKIKKRLPLIVPNQDYEMRYDLIETPKYQFQLISQIKDTQAFALREILLVLEESDGGVIFREVGKIMPLSWAMRALGAQLRQITKSELAKMNEVLRCVAEAPEPVSDQLAARCYR